MKICNSLTKCTSKTSVALGYFDGIHLGHMAVITEAAKCTKNGLIPVLFTFKQNPAEVIKGGVYERITQVKEKEKLTENLGIQILYRIDFNDIKNLSAKEFVSEILHKTLNARRVFCGFNYHFGKFGAGDSTALSQLCKEYNIKVKCIPPVIKDGNVVSSTRIRSLLKNGEIEAANRLLGHNYGFSSTVVEGNHIGKYLNTPTINQNFEKGMILPKYGVYASIVTIKNKTFCGVTNIGVKPTVGNYDPLAETWLPDYNGASLYGENIDVRLIKFLRPEKKFDNFNQLQAAILNDGKTSLKIFGQSDL